MKKKTVAAIGLSAFMGVALAGCDGGNSDKVKENLHGTWDVMACERVFDSQASEDKEESVYNVLGNTVRFDTSNGLDAVGVKFDINGKSYASAVKLKPDKDGVRLAAEGCTGEINMLSDSVYCVKGFEWAGKSVRHAVLRKQTEVTLFDAGQLNGSYEAEISSCQDGNSSSVCKFIKSITIAEDKATVIFKEVDWSTETKTQESALAVHESDAGFTYEVKASGGTGGNHTITGKIIETNESYIVIAVYASETPLCYNSAYRLKRV